MTRHFPVMGAALLLAGCAATTTPRPAIVAAAVPPSFGLQPAGISPEEVERRWWAQFRDPVLDALVTRALANNLAARIAAARVEEARALMRAAGAARLPTGGVDASVQQRRFSEAETFGQPARSATVIQLGTSASWEADLFGRTRRGIEAARAELGGAEALLAAARASVIADVAANYLELRASEAGQRVALEAVRTQQRSLATIQKLVRAGSVSRLDLVRAEAEVRSAEARLPDFERRSRIAANAIAVLIGEAPQTFALAEGTRTGPGGLTRLSIGSPAELLRRRPDVLAAERQVAALSARAAASRADLFPSVRITGVLQLITTSIGNLFTGRALSFATGPSISWSLFDLPRLRAQVGAADARTEGAIANYQATVFRALGEVEDALAAYQAVQQELVVLQRQVTASQEAARLAEIGFRYGEGDFLGVLDAKRQAVSARAALVQAEGRHLLSIVGVYRALGGGWPNEPNQS